MRAGRGGNETFTGKNVNAAYCAGKESACTIPTDSSIFRTQCRLGPMEETTRLDEITVFGGKLSFLIPHSWEETTEENNYLYSHPAADSGWFRVSLNTARAVGETPAQLLKRKFDGRENVTHDEQTGNWVCSYERDSAEKGVKIHLYYWIVAHVVEPDWCAQRCSHTPSFRRVPTMSRRAKC